MHEMDLTGHRFPIHVDTESMKWSAYLPTEMEKPTLFVEGFVGHRLREPRGRENGVLDFGSQRLQLASSLVVQIVDSTGRSLPEARLGLFPESDLVQLVRSSFMGTEEGPRAAHSTTSDQRGWARLAHLPPGQYRLQVTPADAGLPTLSGRLDLKAGEEVLVDRFEARAPATLDVEVISQLMADREDVEWTVIATGSSSCDWRSMISLTAPVNDNGLATFDAIPAGTWDLVVVAETQGSRAQELDRQSIELGAGAYDRIRLQLSGFLFRGMITWLGSPVEAQLQLRSSDGTAVGSTVSDEDGRFEILLGSPGTYDVVISELSNSRMVPAVDFDDPEETVEIRLPEGEIQGMVVDEAGNPVDSASILARQARSLGDAPVRVVTQTEADGTFRLTRLIAGEWQMQATKDPLRSRASTVRLEEDQIESGVSLVVSRGTSARGQLWLNGQPLSDRGIWIFCLWMEPSVPCGGAYRTDSDGRFTAWLGPAPEGAPVNVMVQLAGLPVSSYRLSAGAELEQLAVPSGGGRLVIELPPSRAGNDVAVERLLLLNLKGAMVPTGFGIVEETPGGGTTVTFSSLSPGHWSLFEFDSEPDFVRLMMSAGTDRQPLAAQQLTAGSTATIQLR